MHYSIALVKNVYSYTAEGTFLRGAIPCKLKVKTSSAQNIVNASVVKFKPLLGAVQHLSERCGPKYLSMM